MDVDFDTICRTCMANEKRMFSVFQEATQDTLNRCFQLQIYENDGLPDKICNTCLHEVHRISKFRDRARESASNLQDMLREKSGTAEEMVALDDIKEECGSNDAVKSEMFCEAISFDDGPNYSDSDCQDDIKPIVELKIKKESKIYCCDKCGITFRSKFDLHDHQNGCSESTSSTRMYECNECNRKFKAKKTLKRHFAKLLCRNYLWDGAYNENIDCEKCGLKFSSARGLKFHQMHNKCGDTTLLCKICNCIFSSRKALKRHGYIHANVRYPCDRCTKSFIRPDLLMTHKRKEHDEHTDEAGDPDANRDENKVECPTCGIKLKSQLILQRHNLKIHKILLKCTECNEEFDKPGPYKTHMQKAHGIEIETKAKTEILECETCKKQFKNRFKYKEHLLIHTNERPHLCNICGLGFKAKTTLRFHEMRHVGIKPFKCDLCSRGYYTQKDLKAHKRVHTGEKPYHCTQCGKSYTRSDSLTNHLRVHSGERNYPCEYCPKRFLKRDHLRIHTRIHTGEKPFVCCICDQRFTQKYDMIKHVRRHQESQSAPLSLVDKP